jgi:hypothetical protein
VRSGNGVIGKQFMEGTSRIKEGWIPFSIKQELVDGRAVGSTRSTCMAYEFIGGETGIVEFNIIRVMRCDGCHLNGVKAEGSRKTTINQ